jgi:hypothetical protein
MTLGLREAFNEFFELIHADTEELRHQVYQLRYQVYVLETGFEPSDRCICQDFPGNGRIWMEKTNSTRVPTTIWCATGAPASTPPPPG